MTNDNTGQHKCPSMHYR